MEVQKSFFHLQITHCAVTMKEQRSSSPMMNALFCVTEEPQQRPHCACAPVPGYNSSGIAWPTFRLFYDSDNNALKGNNVHKVVPNCRRINLRPREAVSFPQEARNPHKLAPWILLSVSLRKSPTREPVALFPPGFWFDLEPVAKVISFVWFLTPELLPAATSGSSVSVCFCMLPSASLSFCISLSVLFPIVWSFSLFFSLCVNLCFFVLVFLPVFLSLLPPRPFCPSLCLFVSCFNLFSQSLVHRKRGASGTVLHLNLKFQAIWTPLIYFLPLYSRL